MLVFRGVPQILHESIAFELFHYVCDCMCFVFCQGQSTDNRQKRSEKNGPSATDSQVSLVSLLVNMTGTVFGLGMMKQIKFKDVHC